MWAQTPALEDARALTSEHGRSFIPAQGERVSPSPLVDVSWHVLKNPCVRVAWGRVSEVRLLGPVRFNKT